MEQKRDNTRAELIRLKLDAHLLPLHEWLKRAQKLLERIESEAISRDRLTRVIGSGKVVEVRDSK